jgi:hypothetical protein
MVQLFKDEKPTNVAWPYLDRLQRQDRCFAELDCMPKHGAALYKSPSCEEHFVCKNHQSKPCLAKHEHVLGQEHQAKDDTKNAKLVAVKTVGEEKSEKALAKEAPDTGTSGGDSSLSRSSQRGTPRG